MGKEILCSHILIKQSKQLYIMCMCFFVYKIFIIFKIKIKYTFIAIVIVNIIQYNELH